jgi:CHAT domain-containing protein
VYALDLIAFSYAPSARVLSQAQRIATAIADEPLLALVDPQPVSARALPGARVEARAIAALFATAQVYRATDATRQAALNGLPKAQVVHFSCHGGADWEDSLRSGLLLAGDEVLTVKDLFALHLSGARLATLSACETSIIGTKLPDEVISVLVYIARR